MARNPGAISWCWKRGLTKERRKKERKKNPSSLSSFYSILALSARHPAQQQREKEEDEDLFLFFSFLPLGPGGFIVPAATEGGEGRGGEREGKGKRTVCNTSLSPVFFFRPSSGQSEKEKKGERRRGKKEEIRSLLSYLTLYPRRVHSGLTEKKKERGGGGEGRKKREDSSFTYYYSVLFFV